MHLNFQASSGITLMSLLFLFAVFCETAQSQVPKLLSPPVSNSAISTVEEPVDGTLNIVAVMVEFQQDSNRFTSGNGTFGPGSLPYLEDPGTNIDPLPHDQQYFESHIEFTKNYFEKMSGGRLDIRYHVINEVITLDNKMEVYSPLGPDPGFEPLANLAVDTWEKVQDKGDLSIQLTSYENTAFIIFHAGVGRDIELTGTTLNQTPQDIPSVYLSRSALARLLDDPGFSGFDIDNGKFLVNNTLIMPRTLSREGEDVTGNPFVLPLSINGLLTAQIGSHLGLPDLFNTETGESGIGRFGLMDGAGIFAYNGLFPPALSAWERIFLGWDIPFKVNNQRESSVELPAIETDFVPGNNVAKINISNEEYFLIENRHRDPRGNGVTLTIREPNGTITSQTLSNTDTEFVEQQSGFDQLLAPGVVIDVDHYDFALPGGFDDNQNRDLNGGILIWHIDESVINQKLGIEGINNNPDRRAVNLQEADGAQDIGRPVQIGVSQNEANGSAFDFWWSGNDATVITQTDSLVLYQNRFGPDTTPNNNSNSGAASNYELFDFSDNLVNAGFRIRPVQPFSEVYELIDSDSQVSVTASTDPGDLYWRRYPLALIPYRVGETDYILIPGRDGLQVYAPEKKHLSDEILSINHLQQPLTVPAAGLFTLAPNPQISGDDISIDLASWDGNQFNVQERFRASSNSGFISSFEEEFLDLDGSRDRINLLNNSVETSTVEVQFSEQMNGYQSRIEGSNLILSYPGGESVHSISKTEEFSRKHTGIISINRNEFLFYLLLDGRLSIFKEENGFNDEYVITDTGFIEWPAITDFTQDNRPDFLFIDKTRNQLVGKNVNGAILNNFPITPPSGFSFTGTPLIADLTGNGSSNILVTMQDSYSTVMMGYNEEGDILEGFPILIGGLNNQQNEPIHPLFFDDKLITLSHSGELKLWKFKNLENILYASRYGNNTNNKVSAIIETDEPPKLEFTLLNDNETYNWPNPATDETNLRYQTSEPAEIEIKITTVSGRLIYDKTTQSRGGVPEEILIDTSSWGSGGYLALVTARNSQHTERKLVKIAITK